MLLPLLKWRVAVEKNLLCDSMSFRRSGSDEQRQFSKVITITRFARTGIVLSKGTTVVQVKNLSRIFEGR